MGRFGIWWRQSRLRGYGSLYRVRLQLIRKKEGVDRDPNLISQRNQQCGRRGQNYDPLDDLHPEGWRGDGRLVAVDFVYE